MLISRFCHEIWNRFDQSLIPELLTEDIHFRGSLGQYKIGYAEFAQYVDFIGCARVVRNCVAKRSLSVGKLGYCEQSEAPHTCMSR
jgi:hypothetical protein